MSVCKISEKVVETDVRKTSGSGSREARTKRSDFGDKVSSMF